VRERNGQTDSPVSPTRPSPTSLLLILRPRPLPPTTPPRYHGSDPTIPLTQQTSASGVKDHISHPRMCQNTIRLCVLWLGRGSAARLLLWGRSTNCNGRGLCMVSRARATMVFGSRIVGAGVARGRVDRTLLGIVVYTEVKAREEEDAKSLVGKTKSGNGVWLCGV